MIMETVGNFKWKMENSENIPLFDITIKNISDNKTVLITDIVWATGREDLLAEFYRSAIETLNGEDICCYDGKVSLVEEI